MYACGLRIGEAATVEIASIDSASLLLRVIGKGDKERRVPLPRPMLDDLRRLWLAHRNQRWLCPDRLGTGPVSKNALWRLWLRGQLTCAMLHWPQGPPPSLPQAPKNRACQRCPQPLQA